MADENGKVETKVEKNGEFRSWLMKITDGAFRKFFAVYLTTGAGIFIFKAAFIKGKPSEILLLIVGFVTGTLFTTLVNFYYGTSQSSQDKSKFFEGGDNE